MPRSNIEIDMASEIATLKEKQRELDAEVKTLKKWKDHCTLVAAGWGGICMSAMTFGGLIHSYWEEIKHYFVGQK